MSSSSVSLGRNLVSLKWEEFNIFLVSELASLYQKDDLTDVTLFCEGRSFRAHKVLLSLWSTYFRDVFRGTSHSHPVVILKETNSSDLELILRFIYQGHLLIPIEETDRFLKTAEHFQVAGLKNMRSHVPNFYSTGNNTNGGGGFHEMETSAHSQQSHQPPPPPQQQPTPQATIYDAGTGSGIPLASPQTATTVHPQPTHFRSASTNPPPSTINLGLAPPPPQGPSSMAAHSTPPSHTSSSSVQAMDTSTHHTSPESSNQHQQVIRQGSIQRSIKHVVPPSSSTPTATSTAVVSYSNNPTAAAVGFQATPGAVSSANSSGAVGVVTRLSSESVIYQPQPVLIFQNGSSQQQVPMIKSGEQIYTTRSISGTGEGGRSEQHSMMVIEGVVGDGQVHLEPSSSNSHGPPGSTTYVYAHPSLTPPPSNAPPPQVVSNSHHSSPEVGNTTGTGEEILGLPYNAPSPTPPAYSHHSREVITVDDTAMSSQAHHHHLHHQQQQHHHHPPIPPPQHNSLPPEHSHPHHHHPPPPSHAETEPTTVVVSHSYSTSSTSSYEQSPLQNGSNSSSNSSSLNSQSSLSSSSTSSASSKPKLAGAGITSVVEQPTVYAVKRIPPPLPPSSPPPQITPRNFKGIPTITKSSSHTTVKGKQIPGGGHHSQVTATKSGVALDGKVVVTTNSRSSHAINPSLTNSKMDSTPSSSKNYSQASCSSTTASTATTSNRKVVLVPCPKCGKKVKQTSLKVHMKRTHLEEGTVLVCPICSKRISSKGVYYKHMYIHRKRSEMDSKSPTATAIIKTETQGT